MTSVMISHSHKDLDVSRTVGLFLVAEGIDVAFDEWEVGLGNSVVAWMEDALSKATIVILIWSAAAAASNWVAEERRSALARAVETGSPRVIAVHVDDEPLPPMLDHRKYHRWQGGTEHDRERLIAGVLGRGPSSAFIKAIIDKLEELTINEEAAASGDPLPYKACPRCGGVDLRAWHGEHGRRHYTGIKCSDCSWGDWGEL